MAKHQFYWVTIIVGVYWLCARWLVYRIFPIFVDSAGVIAPFSWAKHLTAVSLAEYSERTATRLVLLLPYWIAASIITLVGCGIAMWICRISNVSRFGLVLISSAGTLCSLLLVGAISDAGTAFHLWRGPSVYARFACIWPFLRVMLPMSLLSGLVAAVLARLQADRT
jgi:hypothetical protein